MPSNVSDLKKFLYPNGHPNNPRTWGICTNLYPAKSKFPNIPGADIVDLVEYLPNGTSSDAIPPWKMDPPQEDEYRYFIKLEIETLEDDNTKGFAVLRVNEKEKDGDNVWQKPAVDVMKKLKFEYHPDWDVLWVPDVPIETGFNWNISSYQIHKTQNKDTTSRSLIVWERTPDGGGDKVQVVTMYPWCCYRRPGGGPMDGYDEADLPEGIRNK